MRPLNCCNARSRIPSDLPDQSLGAWPLVHYTLGWLHENAGDKKAALNSFKQAAALAPDYCFPSRLEEIAVLESAMRANPQDARAPYYLGNLFYDRRRHDEAIRLWEKSAGLEPKFSIVWRNLGIGYFNIRRQPAKARAAYDKAFRANPPDARLLYERDQLWKRLGENPANRLRELEKYAGLVQQRDDLSIELCALYNQTGRHAQAAQLVASRQFQPWEGGEGGPLGQHVRAQLALGRAALTKIDFAGAQKHFELALTSPRNLSEARHLLANQSDIHYWLGCAFAGMGDKKSAREHWLTAANFKGDFQEMSVRVFSEMTYYSALSWEQLGQRAQRQKTLPRLAGLRANPCERRGRKLIILPPRCRRCCCSRTICNSDRRRPRFFYRHRRSLAWVKNLKRSHHCESCSSVIQTIRRPSTFCMRVTSGSVPNPHNEKCQPHV